MATIILGAGIMIIALVILTMAIKMRDRSLSGSCCDNTRENALETHATCATCTCGKIFDKRKEMQKHASTGK